MGTNNDIGNILHWRFALLVDSFRMDDWTNETDDPACVS